MKKLFFISVITLCSVLPSFAQVASVTVFSENGEKFWLVCNGIKQNASAQTNVQITGLTAPNYKLKILFEDQDIPAMDENIMVHDAEDKPNDMTYVIKKNSKGKYVLRVNSFQVASAGSPPPPAPVSQPVHAEGNTTTTTVIHQTTTTNADPNAANVHINMNDGTGAGVNVNMNVSGTDMNGAGNATSTTTATTIHSTTSSSGYSEPEHGEEHHEREHSEHSTKCWHPMNSSDFANAKKSIEAQGFEENKLQVAKQVLKGNCVSSAQVKEVMGLFGFEQTKLDYAKFAYDRTTDQKNYYTINDAFNFSASVTELTNYINSK